MSRVEEDIYQTGNLFLSLVYSGCPYRDDYNDLYFSSNEQIGDILSDYNISNKKCLTVIGSGDQAFHLMDHGASIVDVFDKNKLAIYYYYLRRWCITNKGEFYLNEKITNSSIIDVIFNVKPKNNLEKQALEYWMIYIHRYGDIVARKIFCVCDDPYKNIIRYLDDVIEKIDIDFNYYNVDIFYDTSSINNKYDVIYKSNISEYAPKKKEDIIRYRNNIYNLLNKNGVVLSSCLINRTMSYNEYEIFSELFDIQEMDYRKVDNSPVGYAMIKK